MHPSLGCLGVPLRPPHGSPPGPRVHGSAAFGQAVGRAITLQTEFCSFMAEECAGRLEMPVDSADSARMFFFWLSHAKERAKSLTAVLAAFAAIAAESSPPSSPTAGT